jgi:hypothetical protein
VGVTVEVTVEPPEADPLVGILTSYVASVSLWYFRVNFKSWPAILDPITSCYLRVDISDPTNVVFHNVIRTMYRLDDLKTPKLREGLPKEVLLSEWTTVSRKDLSEKILMDEAEVVVSPSEIIDMIQDLWPSGIKTTQHQRVDLERLKTFPNSLLQAIMLIRSLPSSCRSRNDSMMAIGLTEAINIHRGDNNVLLWDLLIRSASSQDAMGHLSRIRSVRLAWEPA